MDIQNYGNHTRHVAGFHFVLSTFLLLGTVAAAINVYRHIHFEALLSTILILLLFICAFMMWWFIRSFPIRAQDRAIRAEESLRYYILSGKAIDKRLKLSQIIALRFAEDEEFLALAERAIAENLSSKQIKEAIQSWRADHHRV